MNFRVIDQALTDLLGTAAAGRFQVAGYQKQAMEVREVVDNNRIVEVFYSRGEFPKSASTRRGPTRHNMQFDLNLTVAKGAETDLSVIDNPASPPAAVAAAIAATKYAAARADDSWNELADIVYQIIMDAQQIDIGLSTPIADTWLMSIEKDPPLERGSHVVLTGLMRFTCARDEQVEGDVGVAGVAPLHDVTTEYNEDTYGKAGVKTGG